MDIQQTPVLKSRYKIEKEEFDKKVYDRFQELIAIEGAQIVAVTDEILKEFPEIHSPATVWAIRKRVEEKEKKDNNLI